MIRLHWRSVHGRTDRRRTVEKNAVSDLLIERLPLGALKLDPRNPRHHSDRQIRQIARSIKAFGFNVPILIDQTGKVVAGQGRLSAAATLALRLSDERCLISGVAGVVARTPASDFGGLGTERSLVRCSWDRRFQARSAKCRDPSARCRPFRFG
jgi:hypothetical protein